MSSPQTRFTSQKLIEIDVALTTLEPALESFGLPHGFVLYRGDGASYNTPHRRLRRRLLNGSQGINLLIGLPMPEKLERGFYPAIPCSLYIFAQDDDAQYSYHAASIKAEPFVDLAQALIQHLDDAGAKLDACTPEFIRQHGAPVAIAHTVFSL